MKVKRNDYTASSHRVHFAGFRQPREMTLPQDPNTNKDARQKQLAKRQNDFRWSTEVVGTNLAIICLFIARPCSRSLIYSAFGLSTGLMGFVSHLGDRTIFCSSQRFLLVWGYCNEVPHAACLFDMYSCPGPADRIAIPGRVPTVGGNAFGVLIYGYERNHHSQQPRRFQV